MKTRNLKLSWLIPVMGIALLAAGVVAGKTHLDLERKIQSAEFRLATVDHLFQDYQLSVALRTMRDGDPSTAAQRWIGCYARTSCASIQNWNLPTTAPGLMSKMRSRASPVSGQVVLSTPPVLGRNSPPIRSRRRKYSGKRVSSSPEQIRQSPASRARSQGEWLHRWPRHSRLWRNSLPLSRTRAKNTLLGTYCIRRGTLGNDRQGRLAIRAALWFSGCFLQPLFDLLMSRSA